MKAVQVVKYGDAVEGVELREVPEPDAPKPGEVLVGVEFSPINFNDLMVVWGIYSWRPELPATMGNEGAGKVVAVGEGVTAVKVGDPSSCPSRSGNGSNECWFAPKSSSSFRLTPIHNRLR
jgi:NADPH:quinone reductase-like Zn-dependent oxidoreductase